MTPIEQQQMMQEYVRQMLAMRAQQQGGQPGLQAGSRPPLAMGVGQPAPPPGLQVPGAELTGDYGTGPRMGVPQGSAQLMYRQNVPF
jgi:hypothetical protein